MSLDLRDLYGEILLEHSRSTRNRRELPTPPASCVEGDNPLCGDRVSFFVLLRDGTIDDASYRGSGCAISVASASMASDAIRGRTVEDARAIAKRFLDHLTGAEPDDDAVRALPEDLSALSGVRAFPMRVKCATLAWRAMLQAIDRAEEIPR